MNIDVATMPHQGELMEADLSVVAGGYHIPNADRMNPVEFAVAYWTSVSFARTFKDLVRVF